MFYTAPPKWPKKDPMATFQKRGDRWRARVRLKGCDESKEFTTKAAAQSWALELERDIRAGAEGGLSSRSLQDAFDRYLRDIAPGRAGSRWEEIRLGALAASTTCRLPMRKPVVEVTTAMLAAWRDQRLKEVSNGTVAREMTLLSGVFEHARREWQWIRLNPLRDVRKPKEPKARRRGVLTSEIEGVCTALGFEQEVTTLSHQVAVAFLFAIETAMRAGEILALTHDCVHADFVHLKKSKNGDARDVALSKEAVRLLGLLPKGGTKCFTVSSASLDALFRKARDRAGCPDLHFHDSRSEAITRLSKRLDVLELARMVGHRDPRSLMFYYSKSASDIAKKLG